MQQRIAILNIVTLYLILHPPPPRKYPLETLSTHHHPPPVRATIEIQYMHTFIWTRFSAKGRTRRRKKKPRILSPSESFLL